MQVADKVPADRNDGVVFVVQFNREVPVGQALIFCNRVDGDQMGAMHPNKLSGIQSLFQLDKWRADDELSVLLYCVEVGMLTISCIFLRFENGKCFQWE